MYNYHKVTYNILGTYIEVDGLTEENALKLSGKISSVPGTTDVKMFRNGILYSEATGGVDVEAVVLGLQHLSFMAECDCIKRMFNDDEIKNIEAAREWIREKALSASLEVEGGE